MGFIGVQPASVPLTASDITADIINADKIADNSISEEHLDPTIVTGLSALAEAPADTDEFLFSDAGTLKRIDYSYIKGGGGLVLINNTTSASSVANVTFDEVFSATYKNYKIIGEYTAVNSSNDTTSRMRFRTGGSSGSDLSGNEYNYHFLIHPSDSDTSVHKRATGESRMEFTTNQDEDSVRHGVRFDFTVFDPFSSGRTTISGHGRSTATDANTLMFTGACDIQNSSSVTGIKFFVGAGNIKDIAIKIYGIVDS